MLAAARRTPDVTFDLVGGTPEDVRRVRAAAADIPNVTVHGAVSHAQVPPYLWSADLLLLPPSAAEPSAAWTSPVKLGEYLAAGPPIVASRIPGLLSWVDEPAVKWFAPDDAPDMVRAMRESLAESPTHSHARRQRAYHLAHRYSYPCRAAAILHAAGESAHAHAVSPGARTTP
jgi:glycosyltransferase involved in cell wall biosynthesis